jgi:hypothetical protein
MNREMPYNFVSQPVYLQQKHYYWCKRLMGMRLWTNQTFLRVFSVSRQKGTGRRWRERWPSKINLNWGKHCCCCWFGQKWLSNRIKYDSIIFENPQDCCSSNSEWGFGKGKFVCTFCSTLLDTWAKGRSSHILQRHYRDGRCRQNILTTLLMWYGTWCFTYDPETKRQSSEWVGETFHQPKNLKFRKSRVKTNMIIFSTPKA